VERGERLFVRCDGGPSQNRLERFPPPLEVEEHDGTYVLVDDGEPSEWFYQFVPHTP
jgi:hypothetical protein